VQARAAPREGSPGSGNTTKGGEGKEVIGSELIRKEEVVERIKPIAIPSREENEKWKKHRSGRRRAKGSLLSKTK